MTLSPLQKKVLHSVVVGFGTSALAAIQVGLVAGFNLAEKKALLSLLLGAIVAGLSRVAGVLIAAMQTTETPNA